MFVKCFEILLMKGSLEMQSDIFYIHIIERLYSLIKLITELEHLVFALAFSWKEEPLLQIGCTKCSESFCEVYKGQKRKEEIHESGKKQTKMIDVNSETGRDQSHFYIAVFLLGVSQNALQTAVERVVFQVQGKCNSPCWLCCSACCIRILALKKCWSGHIVFIESEHIHMSNSLPKESINQNICIFILKSLCFLSSGLRGLKQLLLNMV